MTNSCWVLKNQYVIKSQTWLGQFTWLKKIRFDLYCWVRFLTFGQQKNSVQRSINQSIQPTNPSHVCLKTRHSELTVAIVTGTEATTIFQGYLGCCCWGCWYSLRHTLQGTNISPKNGILKMIFLFPRCDMLIPWRVVRSHLVCILWCLYVLCPCFSNFILEDKNGRGKQKLVIQRCATLLVDRPRFENILQYSFEPKNHRKLQVGTSKKSPTF